MNTEKMKIVNDSHIRYLVGDAIRPIRTGNKIVAHICNDIGVWRTGFTLAVSSRRPAAREAYMVQKKTGLVLGSVDIVEVEDTSWVANMIAQHGIRQSGGNRPILYEALIHCLEAVAVHARELRATVHMLRIRCGLAGVDER